MDRFLDPLFYTLVFGGFIVSLILGIFEAARMWRESASSASAPERAKEEK